MKFRQLNFSLIKIFALALFFAVTLSMTASASGVDMTGTWTMEVVSPNGTGSPTFTLKQDGQTLSGTYRGRFGEAPVKGTVTDDNFKITYDSSGTLVTYSGVVDGNTCKGDIDYGAYGTATFTGKK